MFKANPDGMRMEPTPERVMSVCRLIAHKSMTREDVRMAMTLGDNDPAKLNQINSSISVAQEELGIITSKGDKLTLAIDPQLIATPESFRRYVGATVFSRKDTTFYMFTKWVIAQNERIFELKPWDVMAKTCGSEVAELSEMKENSALGWRFWAAFLGVGYLSGTMIIPNMKTRIEDVLVSSYADKFKFDEAIRATDFITWLSNKMPEADMSGKLPLALSAGLRTLHELGLIKLETWRDSNRVMLYYVDGDPINDFSHITVKGAIVK